jgi:hypothetical protein
LYIKGVRRAASGIEMKIKVMLGDVENRQKEK